MDYKNKISLKMINMLKSTSSIKVTNHSIIFIRLKGSIFILIELYPESWILKKVHDSGGFVYFYTHSSL